MQSPGLPSFGAAGDCLDDYSLPEDIRDCLMKQTTNYRGSSFVSRWLLFSLGSWVYQKTPEVMDVLHARMASDFTRLCLTYKGLMLEVGLSALDRFATCVRLAGEVLCSRTIPSLRNGD